MLDNNLNFKSIAEVFGIPGAESSMIEVRPFNKLCPRIISDYYFDRNSLKVIMAFLADNGGDGLLISGNFGAGKTSLIRQVAARLNYPMQMLSWSENSDSADLIGHIGISFGDTRFEYGPLSTAMKEGHILVVNEIDRGRAGNLVALNDVLDGGNLLIQETGEIIEPHPDFRLICTANSTGRGDTSGMYTGSVRKLDPAFLDRFWFLSIGYMDQTIEADLLMKRYPDFEGAFILKMVQFAFETRSKADDISDPLSLAFSTRSLDRFLRISKRFGLHKVHTQDQSLSRLQSALAPTYLDRLSAEEHEVAVATLGLFFTA